MKGLLMAVLLASAALSGCAQLQTADAGASGIETQRPQPKSSSDIGNLGLF